MLYHVEKVFDDCLFLLFCSINYFFYTGKKALEPYNIQYWFKNARAALKRRKRRFVNSDSSNHHHHHHHEEQQQPHDLSSPSQLHNNLDEQNHPSIKGEPDSSDEIEDDIDDDIDIEDKQKQQNHNNNYYINYLQAFDISLTDQQRRTTHHSDDSNDDDNISSISEQSPPTQISMNSTTQVPNTTTSFDYNRSRRNRIFIDPTSEVPKLEQWFAIETHPDHILIERICSELNEGEYRTKFPKLESKHIRLWFKNHRAKVKRICRIQPSNVNNDAAIATVETTDKKMHNVQ